MKQQFQVCWGILMLSMLAAKPVIANTILITNPTLSATTLELDGTGNPSMSIVKVADIHLSTDNPQGCTVTISSGSLSKPGGTSIPFQITDVADGAGTPSAGNFTTASGSNHTFSISTAGTRDRDIYIRYTPAALQDPGSYSASIIINISDN
jgi:hypothetical protein